MTLNQKENIKSLKVKKNNQIKRPFICSAEECRKWQFLFLIGFCLLLFFDILFLNSIKKEKTLKSLNVRPSKKTKKTKNNNNQIDILYLLVSLFCPEQCQCQFLTLLV